MDNVPAGQTIGPYRILNQVGQGGMATVYRAYHAAMDRYVAVKILPRKLAESPEFSGRFRQEARTIARLEHAHILPVHDYGESEGFTYLVMRYMETGTLKDRLRAGPLVLAEVDRIFLQLADALDYAHAHGIVHRDLKPSNVLLDDRGNVFLTDFGIAKLLESNVQFTHSGALVGTPAYMSPEQARGTRVDQRADIYSLGVILYEMVTGRVPFEADTPLAVILQHLNDPLPLPSAVKPDLAPAIERVLLKALAKQPEDRFVTAAEFMQAWRAAVAPLLAAPPAGRGSLAPPAPALADAAATALVPPPAPTAPPLTSTGPAAASGVAPAPRPRSAFDALRALLFGPLGIILGGGFLLLCAVASCLALLAGQAGQAPATLPVASRTPRATEQSATERPAPTVAATRTDSSAAETPEPETTPLFVRTAAAFVTPNAGEAGWQSWSAGNTIVTLAFYYDILLTGGPGGVTFWDIASASVDGRLTTADGLPDPNVHLLYVDDEAGLWIGLATGLYEFRGDEVTLHGYPSLDSSTVMALAPTSQGLLAGTAYSGKAGGGLNLLTESGWQAVRGFPSANPDEQPDSLSNIVNVLLEDAAGGWWVGTTNGLGYFDGETWTRFSVADGLPDDYVTALYETDAGELWVGTYGGAAVFTGAGFEPAAEVLLAPVYGLVQDSDGNLWFSGSGGLARQAADSGQLTFFDYTQLPAYTLYAGVHGPDGALYFGSDKGVVRVEDGRLDAWAVRGVPAQAGFGHVLPEPGTERLWFVQEYGVFVDVFDQAEQIWLPGPELPCEYCAPLAWDDEGRLWAGSDLGLWIIDGSGGATHLTAAQGLPADDARAVAFAPDGTTWIATSAGVAVYDGQSVVAVHTAASSGLASDDVHGLLAASDGSLWVLTETNLSRYTPAGEWEHWGADLFDYDVRVSDLAEDHQGGVWATTQGLGAYYYQGGEWTEFSNEAIGAGLPSTDLLSVAVAPDGSVWFGTWYSGAARFDGEDWETFDLGDGLVHDTVNDIYIDDDGTVWFATSGGVSRYGP